MNGQVPAEMVLGLTGVPVVVALVEATKRVASGMDERWYPVVSLAWGLALNLGVGVYLGGDPVLGAVTGVVTALAASGLYSGGRAVTGV